MRSQVCCGDLRAGEVLPDTLDAVDRAAGDLGADDRADRAGPCVAHTACPGGLTDDRDEGVVDVSESGIADLLADERVHARSTGVAS